MHQEKLHWYKGATRKTEGKCESSLEGSKKNVITWHMEKIEAFSNILTSGFTSKCSIRGAHIAEAKGRD